MIIITIMFIHISIVISIIVIITIIIVMSIIIRRPLAFWDGRSEAARRSSRPVSETGSATMIIYIYI